ncbi:hypothetical protein BOX15_Mlig004911g2 [Macrostomum lignano]|uniref:DUF4139 domain-containing protein n=2 Tax=Macrostomum lignano TaxID=282301 RepID=A0A267FM11_9PLAT|nr:hypothetical protein BOX15_Mlig004911g2 [Macrostomum lignano]
MKPASSRCGSAIDRIIGSPSTEFDSLEADGLPGLADFKEDSLYPEELADDYVGDAASANCTPRSTRRSTAAEDDDVDADAEAEALARESEDHLTALPVPSRPPPPPPLPSAVPPPLPSRAHLGPGRPRAAMTAGRFDRPAASMMAQLAEEDFATGSDEVDYGSCGDPKRSVLNASSCQVKSVTVYLDRAEVCRIVRPRVLVGECEVIVRDVTAAIDKDSIRVEVKGPATIADVAYSARNNRQSEDAKAAQKSAAQKALQEEQRALESLTNRQARLRKQRDVLNSFADMLIRKPEPSVAAVAAAAAEIKATVGDGATQPQAPAAASIDAFDPKHMDTLSSFFNLYDRQAGRLDDDLLDTRVAIQKKEEAVKALEKQLRDIEARYNEMQSREISIVLECQETTQLELYLSYVVSRAKWSPKYDVRVFSNESAMKIIYYGLVQQSTGEDWVNSQLSLSTSQPGVGGTAPALGVHRAHFKAGKVEPTVTLRKTATKARKSSRVVKALSFHANDKVASNLARMSSADPDGGAGGGGGAAASSDEAAMTAAGEDAGRTPIEGTPMHGASSSAAAAAAAAAASGSAVTNGQQEGTQIRLMETLRSSLNVQSTQFEVPRLFTIPSDGEQHKVTIAIIDLSPTFSYESVPRRAPYAYLKANVTNTSAYALLAGPANIYVDNNFISKSELKAAAPLEEFSCPLGADHGIKINYKPMFKKRDTGQSKTVSFLHRQVIEVKNNHQKALRVLVMESYPLSVEDKIKVSLIEPQVKHPEKYDRQKPIRVNKANNVEWDIDLEAGESKELVLRYSIEHPAGEILDYTVAEA